MTLRRLSEKRSGYLGPDRAVATVAFLMVAVVSLLIGFSGPSVDFRLPGLAGWIYIGVVIIVAIAVLVWLTRGPRKRKKRKR
jgi:preprotein translocase subunit SecF